MIHDGFTQAGELAIARRLVQLAGGTGVTVNSVLPDQPHRGRGSVAREMAGRRGQAGCGDGGGFPQERKFYNAPAALR